MTTNAVITVIANPPIEGGDALCPKCEEYTMVETNGQRDNHNLYFCEKCGATQWILDEEVVQQQQRERYLLKQRYGVERPRDIRDYWQKGITS